MILALSGDSSGGGTDPGQGGGDLHHRGGGHWRGRAGGDSDPSLASASAAWEAARFLAEPEQQNWSIIRSRPRVGLVSGYASNLMPLLDMYNFRSYNGGETMDSAPDAPYTYFILEVLVTGRSGAP
ncbi:MAG: hypothetical protein ACLR5H_14625 [Oscillospiraceae bacterium]